MKKEKGKWRGREGRKDPREEIKYSLRGQERETNVKLEDVWGHHLMILNVSILIKKPKRLD